MLYHVNRFYKSSNSNLTCHPKSQPNDKTINSLFVSCSLLSLQTLISIFMASFTSNLELSPHHTNSSPEFKRKKRRKLGETRNSSLDPTLRVRLKRWTTQTEHQIYSSKLIQALRRSRRASSAAGKDVRQTADRVLAVSAKGSTHWSRAILATPLCMRKHKKAKVIANTGLRKPGINRDKTKLPVVDRKFKALRRLVPGCRKLSFPNLLEETTDYIAALEMQVRAMTAITEFLTAGAGGGARLESNVNY